MVPVHPTTLHNAPTQCQVSQPATYRTSTNYVCRHSLVVQAGARLSAGHAASPVRRRQATLPRSLVLEVLLGGVIRL